MKRTKKRKPPAVQRTRGKPHQIYLSEEESAAFRAKAEARGKTLSDLVRFWINLEPRKRKSAAAVSGVEPDPRQTHIDDYTPRPEGEALREWAEREGRTDLLQEALS